MAEQSFLQFEDLREYVANRLGTESWTTVYEYTERDGEKTGYFCALVKPDAVQRRLGNTSWDLLIGRGMPGVESDSDGTWRYYRFGYDEDIAPFIIDRDFHGLKPSYLEVSEEFRHFHDLYEDRRTGVFTALDDNGDDVEVVRMTTKKVQVRAKFLRDYLAARGMHMMLFFEFDRWSTKTLDELGLEKQNEDRQEAAYRYVRFIDTWPSNLIRKTFARLLGKKVLKGTDNYRPALLWDRESQQYEDFTIGVDESRPTARRIGTPLASR